MEVSCKYLSPGHVVWYLSLTQYVLLKNTQFSTIQSTDDPIADLLEDMAAEQKARITYDNILALVDDEEIKAPIRFLREREIVHFQRFGEALEIVKSNLNKDNYYYCNPELNCQNPRNDTVLDYAPSIEI